MKFILLTMKVDNRQVALRADLIESAVQHTDDCTRVYIVNGNGYYDVTESPETVAEKVTEV